MNHSVKIKPLSVNEAWQGKRFKTPKYNRYERELLKLLPDIEIERFERLSITFFVSSVLSDIDNPLKPFIDVLQKRYKVNDRDLKQLIVNKEIVKKGEERIEFEIF